MNLRDYQFRPRILPTTAVGLALPLLLGLGLWQLDRSAEKETLAAELEQMRGLPPMELTAITASGPIPAHRRLFAEGTFEPEGQIFLENRRQGGRIGFHVLTPLRLAGSDLRLMVNRGWIPAAGTEPSPAPVPDGKVRVEGIGQLPHPPAIALGNPADWGQRWPYFTVEDYAARTGLPLVPVLLLQAPDNPHGFQRDWPEERPNPIMHLGYAVQWFAFALIAVIIYLRLSFVRKEPKTR